MLYYVELVYLYIYIFIYSYIHTNVLVNKKYITVFMLKEYIFHNLFRMI